MPVDRTWLLVTELYAIVAVVSLFALLAAVVVFVLRVKRTVRQTSARVRRLAEQQRAAARSVRTAATDIGASAAVSAGLIRTAMARIAAAMKGIGS